MVFGRQIINGSDVSDILANHNGYLVDTLSKEKERLSIEELSLLFDMDTSGLKLAPKQLPASEDGSFADPSFEALSRFVQKFESSQDDEMSSSDFVELSYKLRESIPFIV